MRTCFFFLLLIVGLVAWTPAEDPSSLRSKIKDRELQKLAGFVDDYFKGLESELQGERESRKLQVESLKGLTKELASMAKKAKIKGSPLKYLGDWEQIFELAKPQERDLTGKAGRGFVRRQFDDPYGESASIAYLLSLPKDYAKRDEFYPAILALKPVLDLSGDDLEEDVIARAEAIYADLTNEAIILIPLGPLVGEGRRQEVEEVTASWLTPEGMLTCFTTLRVLSEEVRFDRSRLVLDGWGQAGEDALRLVSRAPQWFAGVINRGGPVGGDGDIIDANLVQVPFAYVVPNSDSEKVDAARLAALNAEVIQDEGDAMAPSDSGRSALASWMKQQKRVVVPKTIDFRMDAIEYQSIYWVKAAFITRRPTAVPSDKDFPRIQAKADRATNTITIDTVGIVDGVRLYLSDALVDLDKPVLITVNGKERLHRSFDRSIQTLLENRFFNNSGDLGAYTAEVLIEDID